MARIASAPALAARPYRSRPRWWREILVLGVIYLLYEATRVFVVPGNAEAFANGRRVMDLEGTMHIVQERAINDFVSARPALGITMCYSYAIMHYLVTLAVLVWLWTRRPHRYSGARTALLVGTLIALIGFWLFPTAPPRMLPGFVDTLAEFSKWGWWGTDASAPKGMGSMTNEFAAMPSLHVGWALWCGWQVVRSAPSRVVQVLAVIYPAWIFVVVVGTANHYVADAIAGAMVIGIGAVTVWLLRRYHVRARFRAWATAARTG